MFSKKLLSLVAIVLMILAITADVLFASKEGAASSQARLKTPAEMSDTAPAVSTGEVPEPLHERQLKEARVLSQGPNHEKAGKLYETLYKQVHGDASFQRKVAKEYATYNRNQLFSKNKSSGSEIYVVVPGDSLYKIAQQYKTTVELIKVINNLESDVIHPDMKLKVITGKFTISVDKSDNELHLFLDGKPIEMYTVATGENSSTPEGQFKIVNKLINPTWYHAGAVVPPESPENILGTRWMGFDLKGYGIHGTTKPESIGTQASAGCIRMLNKHVEEIYAFVPHGTQVTIRD